MMTRILLKRVYEPIDPDDGYRVLVDRLWPRGMRKEMLVYDLWAKDIAPSDALRRWYHADPEARWGAFGAKYAGELRNSPAVIDFVHRIASHPVVTLLYGAKNSVENHAVVLQEYLQKALARSIAAPTTA